MVNGQKALQGDNRRYLRCLRIWYPRVETNVQNADPQIAMPLGC